MAPHTHALFTSAHTLTPFAQHPAGAHLIRTIRDLHRPAASSVKLDPSQRERLDYMVSMVDVLQHTGYNDEQVTQQARTAVAAMSKDTVKYRTVYDRAVSALAARTLEMTGGRQEFDYTTSVSTSGTGVGTNITYQPADETDPVYRLKQIIAWSLHNPKLNLIESLAHKTSAANRVVQQEMVEMRLAEMLDARVMRNVEDRDSNGQGGGLSLTALADGKPVCGWAYRLANNAKSYVASRLAKNDQALPSTTLDIFDDDSVISEFISDDPLDVLMEPSADKAAARMLQTAHAHQGTSPTSPHLATSNLVSRYGLPPLRKPEPEALPELSAVLETEPEYAFASLVTALQARGYRTVRRDVAPGLIGLWCDYNQFELREMMRHEQEHPRLVHALVSEVLQLTGPMSSIDQGRFIQLVVDAVADPGWASLGKNLVRVYRARYFQTGDPAVAGLWPVLAAKAIAFDGGPFSRENATADTVATWLALRCDQAMMLS